MAKFADIARGTRATRTVDLPLDGDAVAKVLVRPLNGLETGRVVAEARAYAIAEVRKARKDDSREPPEPKEGERLYDLGYMAATLAVACEDPAAPGTPFFTDAQEILQHLDADRIVLLYEQQQAWQDACAPSPARMDAGAFLAMVVTLAGEDEGSADSPFDRLRPALRRSWARTIASLYANSLTPKSRSGSPSGDAAGS